MSSSHRGGVFNERSFKNVPNDYLKSCTPASKDVENGRLWMLLYMFWAGGGAGLGNHCIKCNEFSEPLRACLPMAFGFFVKRFKN